MIEPVCLITGCSLRSPDGSFVHGDLHRLGGMFIFNAITAAGRPAWSSNYTTERMLMLSNDRPWFERRGVFVTPIEGAELSPEAREFLGLWAV